MGSPGTSLLRGAPGTEPEYDPGVPPSDALRTFLVTNGLLLKQGREIASAVALITREDVRGSWWSHTRGREIFVALEDLDDWHDAILTKLVLGKDTFVHRRLWPAILVVGREQAEWQMRGLRAGPSRLLARLSAEGEISGVGADGKDLARRLLAVHRQEHSTAGRHVTTLQSWTSWARRQRVAAGKLTPAPGRARIEAAVTRLGGASDLLPWH